MPRASVIIIASSDIRIRTSLPSQMLHLSAVYLGLKNAVLLCLFPAQVVRAINITFHQVQLSQGITEHCQN